MPHAVALISFIGDTDELLDETVKFAKNKVNPHY